MSQSRSSLETFWRAIIMLGTAVVAGMAFCVYGPPPDKALAALEQVWERLAENAAPPANDEAFTTPALGDEPAGLPAVSRFAEELGELTESPAAAPAYGMQTASLGSPNPLPGPSPQRLSHGAEFSVLPQNLSANPRIAPLAAELVTLGAENLQLESWGSSGEFHRFRCSAPTKAGFRRHLDAIEATPLAAVTVVLSEMRALQSGVARF